MVNYLKSSLLLLPLLGCYTPKKAERQLSKAQQYPDKVAKVCTTMFPVKESIDTVEHTEYDFIELEGQDRTIYIDKIKTDTVVKYVTRKVKVPGKTVTITKTVKDTAEIFKLGVELQNWIKENEKQRGKTAKAVDLTKLLAILAATLLLILLIKGRREKRNA